MRHIDLKKVLSAFGTVVAAYGVSTAAENMVTIQEEAAAVAEEGLGGDAAAGKKVFLKCMSCHSVKEGQNKVGPSLAGIVGREAGSVDKFNYSKANAESGVVWTEAVLFDYLENPREYMPGTKMIFPGLPSEEDRKNVIAYLKDPA